MKIDWQPLGIAPADILLPREAYLNPHWPVVALDQYTSQPEIWQAVEREIGDAPSTLRLIVPEAFLDETEPRSRAVLEATADYLARDIFTPLQNSFVLVERSTQSGKRLGLVITIDLEAYEYRAGSQSLIRATEQTVLDRIPPRLIVREQSAIELPHAMVLVDDPGQSLIEPLYARRGSLPMVYDIELLMQGGHIRGWQVADEEDQAHIAQAILKLKEKLKPGDPLYAIGDGNHSLAAAKDAWENHKARLSPDEQQHHPARYAMVELVNLHCPALLFEPIHRVAFGVDRQKMLDVLAALEPAQDDKAPDIVLIDKAGDLPLKLRHLEGKLVVDAVQRLLDEAALPLDYVHGIEATRDIAAAQGGVGILMPDFPKDQLFPTVQREGRLPRKTFSMGEANEKRFYLEARRII